MKLPDPLKKSLLLYGDHQQKPASVDKLADYGDLYEQEGLIHDALEFYRHAGVREAMERIRKRAVEEGDFFLYRQAAQYLGDSIRRDDLMTLSAKALAAGKLKFALLAAREAGDEKTAAEIENRISGGNNDTRTETA